MLQSKKKDYVIFDSSTGLITDGNKILEINRQGCRCLSLLVSRPDTVVSKDELIEMCWRKYGTIVSDNTVRQVLFQLRKKLEELNLPPDTLNTLPRQGYSLTSGRIAMGTVSALDGKIDTDKKGMITAGDAGKDLDSIHDSTRTHTDVLTEKENQSLFFSHVRGVWMVAVLGMVLFVAVCVTRYTMLVSPLHYQEIHRDSGHVYFIQQGFKTDNKIILTRAARIMGQEYIKDVPGQYVYINRSEKQNLSLFVCMGPVEEKNNICTPVTVLGDF